MYTVHKTALCVDPITDSRVDADRAQAWSQEEVLRRWTRLYVGPELVQRYVRDGEAGLCAAQLDAVHGWAETYRSRLADLSWFMRVLNQSMFERKAA